MVSNTEILKLLARPFHPSHVQWKPGMMGKEGAKALALAYADLRAYQNRLDELCGMDWSVTYTPWGDRLVCHLTVNGVTRSSTGESDSQSERSEIGGTAMEAQAFKRACAMFGLGRYLYNLPSVWVEYDPTSKQFTDKAKAKLEAIIIGHYRRTAGGDDNTAAQPEPNAPAPEPPAPAQAAEATPPGPNMIDGPAAARLAIVQVFEEAGQELYGAQWAKVKRHNVERITYGQAHDISKVTDEQLQKLIKGMRKLQAKRHTGSPQGAARIGVNQ